MLNVSNYPLYLAASNLRSTLNGGPFGKSVFQRHAYKRAKDTLKAMMSGQYPNVRLSDNEKAELDKLFAQGDKLFCCN